MRGVLKLSARVGTVVWKSLCGRRLPGCQSIEDQAIRGHIMPPLSNHINDITMILYYSGHIMPPLSSHINDIILYAGILCLPLKLSSPWHSNGHTLLCQLHKSVSASTLGFVPRSTYTAIDMGDSQRIGNCQSGLQSLPESLPRADVCGALFTWLVLTTQMDHSYHSQKSQRHAASNI